MKRLSPEIRMPDGRSAPAPRQGWLLFELSLVMVMTMVLCSGAVLIIALMLSSSRGMEGRLADERTLMRLAEQFRADVHQASLARTAGAESTNETLELQTGEGRIVYAAGAAWVDRTFFSPTGRPQHERFNLPGASVQFASSETEGLVRLMFRSPPERTGLQASEEALGPRRLPEELVAALAVQAVRNDQPVEAAP